MIDMELGPIRPPSEAESLMLRVTRGCHWNKCYFCDLYKKYKFSRRRYEEIEEDLKKAADSELYNLFPTGWRCICTTDGISDADFGRYS